MKSQIVLFLIYILISLPFVSHGEGVVHLLIQESEYELARLELYKQYYGADSLAKQTILPIIAYTYQLEGNHLKAKTLYRRAIQNSSSLSAGHVDSIKTNLCYSLIELNEYGTAYGLFSTIDNNIALPVKKRFYILTAERNYLLSEELFSTEEIISFNEFANTLKKPRTARLLSAVFPGLGQFYSSHYVDGLQALMVVGAGVIYSTVAYQAYQREKTGLVLPVFTMGVTALFHYANILSGYRTAIYRNMRLKQDYLSQTGFDTHPLDLTPYLKLYHYQNKL